LTSAVAALPVLAPEFAGAAQSPPLTRAGALKVGGLTPFSATDYPGQLASVVFVQGCPWRCGYCHNPHLQPRTAGSPLTWSDILARLQRRVGLIDAVVFSGGEPTMDPALADAIHAARALGFGIGLHTAGIYPRRLAEVLPLVDWVGLDVKAGWAHYDAVTRIAGSAEPARASLEAVLRSGVAHEVRTTLHPALHTAADLLALATELSALGVQRYVVQQFRATGCADGALAQVAPAKTLDEALLARLRGLFAEFVLRDMA
jgi:anaerobic ribonucleoside-triphosphate reductase activating protein